jgi:hypothetical protein
MANITISDLQVAELEYAELSDLELEVVVGGKEGKVEAGYSQEQGVYASASLTF